MTDNADKLPADDGGPGPTPEPTGPTPAPEPAATGGPEATTAAPEAPSPGSAAGGPTASRRPSGLDAVLAVVLVVWAFLLGSFAVRNSDFLMHLATGRYLTSNITGLWADPFSFTTEGRWWVNHSWLYDLVLYWGYSLIGGTGVVIVRALVVAGIAVVLLQVRDRKAGLWLPVAVAAIGLLAMGPRLLLQPVLMSLLFLALTLWVLLAPRAEEPPSPSSGGAASGPRTWGQFLAGAADRRLWWLLPLFWVWACVDDWFVLGPLCVGLAWLGESLDGRPAPQSPGATRRQQLGLVFGGGLVVCLLTPNLYGVYTLPMELGYILRRLGGFWPEGLIAAGSTVYEIEQIDPQFTQRLAHWYSPFSTAFFYQGTRFVYPPALGYLLLVLLGVASFVCTMALNPDAKRSGSVWSRFFLWMFFGGLAATLGRLIPLFAVVSCPVIVLNFQEFLANLTNKPNPGPAAAAAGRGLLLALLAFAVVFTWPGWLRGPWGSGESTWRVWWAVETNPSLERAAAALARAHGEGEPVRAFNYNLDVAGYTAWFAPGVKTFYDDRFALFLPEAREVANLRQSLRLPRTEEEEKGFPRRQDYLDEAFTKAGVTDVVWSGLQYDPQALAYVFRTLRYPSRGGRGGGTLRWALAEGDGRAAVARWWPADGQPTTEQWRQAEIDFPRLAFATGGGGGLSDRAAYPLPADAWVNYFLGSPTVSPDAARAEFYIGCREMLMGRAAERFALLFGWPVQLPYQVLFDQSRERYENLFGRPEQSLYLLASQAAAAAPAAGPAGQFAAGLTAAVSVPAGRPDQLLPEAAVVLAVRAARQATRDEPSEMKSFLALASAYSQVMAAEALITGQSAGRTEREQLRRIQRTAAWRGVVTLDPLAFQVHQALAEVFAEQYYLDLALEQLAAAKQVLDSAQGREDIQERLEKEREKADKDFKNLAEAVEARRKDFQIQASRASDFKEMVVLATRVPYQFTDANNKKHVDRRGYGLAGEALKILDAAAKKDLSPQDRAFVTRERLQLLINTGRIEDAAEVLNSKAAESLPSQEQLLYRARAAAAVGDYATAVAALKTLEEQSLQGFLAQPAALAVFPAELLTPTPSPASALVPLDFRTQQWQVTEAAILQPLAVLRSLRGLLALEGGSPAAAESAFAASLATLPDPDRFPELNLARHYLRAIRSVNSAD